MAVYLDLVLILNFMVDFLLLLGTNRLSGFPPGGKRAALAALLGAVYSGVCMLPGFRFLGNLLWRIVCLGLMGVTAFGWNRSAVKRAGVFVLLSMALGGIALSFGRSDFPVLVLSALCVFLLAGASFGSPVGSREYVNIALTFGSNTASVIALRDTGNSLRDPVTGEAVLIISGDVARKLTGLTQAQIQNPMQTLLESPMPGLRLIPYRSVGNPGGMLLGMRFEKCIIDGKHRPTLVALAPETLVRGEVYQALTGGIA